MIDIIHKYSYIIKTLVQKPLWQINEPDARVNESDTWLNEAIAIFVNITKYSKNTHFV